MSETSDAYSKPAQGWTCFHCGETFTTVGSARIHFGETPDEKPGCVLKVELGERGLLLDLRKVQAENAKLRDDISNEDTFYREYHAKLASEIQLIAKPFRECRSLRDVFNVFDSMEGRALAAEEQLAIYRRRLRLAARGLLFYAHSEHLVGFAGWEAPDQSNWDCPPQEPPDLQTLESMMVENGGWAAACLRKIFGRRLDKRGWSKLLGEKPVNFCSVHELRQPCGRCDRADSQAPTCS